MLKHLIVLALLTSLVYGIIVRDPPEPGDYKYSYTIQDPTTGDTKTVQESKQGNFVKGSYTVLDPDGIKRTVEYTADAERGFNAVVSSVPPVNKNQPVSERSFVKFQPQPSSLLYTKALSAAPENGQHYLRGPIVDTDGLRELPLDFYDEPYPLVTEDKRFLNREYYVPDASYYI